MMTACTMRIASTTLGASPRGSIALERCARARAWLDGRDFVAPEDVRAVAPDVLRHRVLPSFEATLTRISPGSVQGNRTVAVYFKVDNPQQQLRSGQFSTARLALGSTRQGLQVPKTALREVQGKPVVYRITAQNTLQTVPVSTGLEQVSSQGNSLIEVREGLNAGDRIVGVNLGPLPEGATVSIQPTAQ